ncbi:hypothetical protein BGZ83_001798, partial [Gryganskiella cystojenkinii]
WSFTLSPLQSQLFKETSWRINPAKNAFAPPVSPVSPVPNLTLEDSQGRDDVHFPIPGNCEGTLFDNTVQSASSQEKLYEQTKMHGKSPSTKKMDLTQPLYLIGSTNIDEICVATVHGQNVVYWADIRLLFPRASYVKNGNVLVGMMKDESGNEILPLRIKYHPGRVLQVHVDSGVSNDLSTNNQSGPHHTRSVTGIENRPSSLFTEGAGANRAMTPVESVSSLAISDESLTDFSPTGPRQATLNRRSTTHILNQLNFVTAAIEQARQSGESPDSESLSSLINSKLVPTVRSKLDFENYVVHRLETIDRTTQDNLALSKQMNDRLILIQRKTEAILTQQLELAEYPIPRLFIVLPEEVTKYDPGNWFRTKFRLHFICECGEHTKVPGSKLPNHLHLAKHGGYLIREPTVFFKKYGPFLLLMLELIKFGTSIAGHVVPTLASLKIIELADSVAQTVESVNAKIDYSLQCIDKQSDIILGRSTGDFADTESSTTVTQQDLDSYLSGVEGLEGVELRQLGSFLKTSKDENLLGNLYRMTTSDGHVKWVCLDHYRAGYQEAHTQKLREVVDLARGKFDEQLGKVTITLFSKLTASEFYSSLSKAKGVLELNVILGHECSRSELQGLEVALKKSRVSILRLNLCVFGTTLGSKLLSTSTRFEALFRIRENPNMREIHYVLPPDVTKIISFEPKKSSHTCKLTFDIHPSHGSIGEKVVRVLAEALKTDMSLTSLNLEFNSIRDSEAQALGEALKTNTTLTSLILRSNSIGSTGCQALGKALKTNTSMTFLDLQWNFIGDIGAQRLGEALKTNKTLRSLNLEHNSIEDSGGQALGEALKTNTTLTELLLKSNSIGDSGAQALGKALKINTSLTSLNLEHNSIGDSGGQALGEAFNTNTSMTSLSLQGNSIGDSVCLALEEVLKNNTYWATLDLENN